MCWQYSSKKKPSDWYLENGRRTRHRDEPGLTIGRALSRNNPGQLFPRPYIPPSLWSIVYYRHRAVALCSWEGNRRSGVAVATCHGQVTNNNSLWIFKLLWAKPTPARCVTRGEYMYMYPLPLSYREYLDVVKYQKVSLKHGRLRKAMHNEIIYRVFQKAKLRF